MVTACYLVVTGGYCSLPGGYWWLLLVTGGYCLLLFVPNFSMNSFFLFLASNLCLVRLLQSQHKRGVSVLKVFSSNDLMVLFILHCLPFLHS